MYYIDLKLENHIEASFGSCNLIFKNDYNLITDSKKTNSENVSILKVGVLNVEFALQLRIYKSLKSLICIKWIRKKLSTTLYTQLPYIAGHSL